jgi:pyruvate/2-oxoglutarate dehydrogenase complex dihydrolipoamide acyltransferase (E2) component
MLALLESEKVNLELPSPVSGVVAEYLVQIGETVPVGSPLAVIADAAEFEQSSEA